LIKTLADFINFSSRVSFAILLLGFICFPLRVNAQEPFPSIFTDTTGIKPYNKLFNITDTASKGVISFDSLLILKSRKYNLKNEIRNLIVIPENRIYGDQKAEILNYSLSIHEFTPYKDKIIRNIKYQQLEVLGQNVLDLSEKPDNWFEKLINALHIKTQKNIIENNVIFHTGENVDPTILADNERIIRKMPNIHDARIIPISLNSTNDSVDILVVTKDVLPVGFGIELFDLNKGQAGIWSKNLLGIGHEMYYYLQWNLKASPVYGHKLRYRINNIGNTFISSDATYENNWDTKSYKFYLNREFFTPDIKYAGGAGFEKNKLLVDFHSSDTLFVDQLVDYNYSDFWVGRSIRFNAQKNMLTRRNLSVTGRLYKYNFFNRPDMVNQNHYYSYHSRTTILLGIGISRQAYVRSRYIYGFGRPEDIPYGSYIHLIGGREFNEFNTRNYAAIQFSSGYYFQKFGYLYQQTEYGTFINNGVEQGTIKVNAKYFTSLLNANGRFKHRIFTDINYIRGFNRNSDEYIELSSKEGIRGLNSTALHGNERLFVNIEYDCYSPHKLYGFFHTYFLFFDAGCITDHGSLLQSPVYSGFGAGVKIRNENLVFNTIFIRIGYYPRLPDPRTVRYYEFYGKTTYEYPSFEDKKPEIVKFQN
jgi:hypothetical protein